MNNGLSPCRRPRFHGWWPLILLAMAAPLLAIVPFELRGAMPAWLWAWGLVFAFFGAMKWLTWRRMPAAHASPWLHIGYLVAWPGLDATTFFRSDAVRDEPVDSRIGVIAIGKMFFGAALFWGVARFVPDDRPLVRGWGGLAGLAIGVLGGLFQVMSWLWRAGGVDARPIMNAPLRSKNIAEFWNKRWNIAFHDFAGRFIYRPLAGRYGTAAALVGVFLFSGLLHDAVISLSAGAGYGLPTLYFLIQFVGLGIERGRFFANRAARHPLAARVFAVLVIVGPAGLLFHPPFIERVWLPFMAFAGAL